MKHIADVAHGYQQMVRTGAGPALTERPVTQTARQGGYYNRPTLDQLDCSHSGVRRAVDAARVWKDRYNAAMNPANESPARAPSLILSGPNGTGKTHIARAIQWSRASCPVDETGEPLVAMARPAGRWFDAADLVLALAPTQTEWRTVEYASVGQLIGPAPFAIVDDLGGEGTIPFVAASEQSFERQARWFRFVDFCYDRQVSLIITTNLDIQSGALAEWVGRRAWDRLGEMAPTGQMVGLWDVPSWRVRAGGR